MKFHVQVPVRWADLDAFRHVNHARAVTLLEEARAAILFRRATEDGVGEWSSGLLVADLRVDYKRQIPYRGQTVRVSMWTSNVRAATFRLSYEMRTGPDEQDPIAVIASTMMVPFDLAVNRPRRLTEQERAFLIEWAE